MNETNFTIPIVIEKQGQIERSYDIYSRLLKDRIIFLGNQVEENISNSIVAQLLFLEHEDSGKDIFLYINSPGGSVSAGLAIYDTMNYIKSPVSTICIGLAASMGALLLTAGAKGKRISLPNSEIMIHQPSSGVDGKATDVKIYTEQLMKTKNKLNTIISNCSGQPFSKVENDTERDYFMSAEEALEYGLIDKIISQM